MDGASLCIYTVSSINNPRCAWHGGVPESPFVIMDCWRLHKPLPPAESALCQAPRASPGPPSFPGGTPAGGGPLALGLCPHPAATGTPQAPWLLGGFCCLQSLCRAKKKREQLGSFLLALAWEVWLFIGGFAVWFGFFFPLSSS